MTSLPGRAVRDLRTLVRTPAALSAAVVFVAVAAAAVVMFPGAGLGGGAPASARRGAGAGRRAAPAPPRCSSSRRGSRQQPRVPVIVADADGAAVVIVKFNDYQCPPCRQTYHGVQADAREVGQAGARQGEVHHQGLPLERECNPFVGQDLHSGACEAAVAVRLAREKGKAEAMEEWLFANQPAMKPDTVKTGAPRTSAASPTSTRAIAGHARTGEGRHRAGRAAEGHRHADLLHERHAPARAARRVLRRGHRLGAEAASAARADQ